MCVCVCVCECVCVCLCVCNGRGRSGVEWSGEERRGERRSGGSGKNINNLSLCQTSSLTHSYSVHFTFITEYRKIKNQFYNSFTQPSIRSYQSTGFTAKMNGEINTGFHLRCLQIPGYLFKIRVSSLKKREGKGKEEERCKKC